MYEIWDGKTIHFDYGRLNLPSMHMKTDTPTLRSSLESHNLSDSLWQSICTHGNKKILYLNGHGRKDKQVGKIEGK